MDKKWEHIYGPVPSRRLGLSLGIDLVPYKTCNFDCIYCQLGRTKEKTVERKGYISAGTILKNLFLALETVTKPDFLTLAGSGEPTLNSEIDIIISEIKKKTDIPVAVLTNGSLLSEFEVRKALLKADVVLPSLDAGDETTFIKINRPHESIHLEQIIGGMTAFRQDFEGAIWLEVFCVDGINTSDKQLQGLKEAIERIRPDKIQLNTAVRPPAESSVRAVDDETLGKICALLGSKCEVIVKRDFHIEGRDSIIDPDSIMAILSRRPCTLSDLTGALNTSPNHILKTISDLLEKGTIRSYFQNRELFYTKAS